MKKTTNEFPVAINHSVDLKVSIAPTHDETGLYYFMNDLIYNPKGEALHTRPNQHMYFTSDTVINVGDYVIQTNFEKSHSSIIKIENEMQCKYANDKDGSFTKRKIIASTDTKLKDAIDMICTGSTYVFDLPKIPQSFVQEYCENKNIDEVKLQLEKYDIRPDNSMGYFEPGAYTFKTRFKLTDNNEVIIA
jgi:hypothetical protein